MNVNISYKISFLIMIMSCLSFFAHAENIANKWLDKTMTLETDEKNPSLAKKELIEKITAKISEDLIKEMIGESKFNRNNTIIQNKLIKHSARFIPFSKPSELVATPEGGYKMTLALKVSQEDLRTMLLENGLLYESDSTPLLLPAISITDKVNGKEYGWWQSADSVNNKQELVKYSSYIENSLKQIFSKNGFYVLRPQTLKYSSIIPYLESKNQDWQAIAQDLFAQILLQGDLVVSKNPARSDSFLVRIHITAMQVQNDRSIADVVRNYETDSGAFDFVVDKKIKENIDTLVSDLSTQVFEAWQKGTIGSNLFKLTFNGNIPIQNFESLKNVFVDKITEIKSITERSVSYDHVTFEIDTNLTPKEIKSKLPKWSIPGYSMDVDDVSDQEIQYKVHKEEVK
jgi:hypothetical protein